MTWMEIVFWGALTLVAGTFLTWFLGKLHIFDDQDCAHVFTLISPTDDQRKRYRCVYCGHEETL